MVNRTISIKAMTISCKGEVFPMTTPKEIKTAAEAKSLSNMLKNSRSTFDMLFCQKLSQSRFDGKLPISQVHVNLSVMKVKESNNQCSPLEADHSTEHV